MDKRILITQAFSWLMLVKAAMLYSLGQAIRVVVNPRELVSVIVLMEQKWELEQIDTSCIEIVARR